MMVPPGSSSWLNQTSRHVRRNGEHSSHTDRGHLHLLSQLMSPELRQVLNPSIRFELLERDSYKRFKIAKQVRFFCFEVEAGLALHPFSQSV